MQVLYLPIQYILYITTVYLHYNLTLYTLGIVSACLICNLFLSVACMYIYICIHTLMHAGMHLMKKRM